MRNGPVVEARPYLQPVQTKLVMAELERLQPSSTGVTTDDTTLHQMAVHLGTFNWFKVRWVAPSPGTQSCGEDMVFVAVLGSSDTGCTR
eukprot:4886606-Pyramimonas_sp.AAC.1